MVVAAEPRVDRGDREGRVCEVPLQIPTLFHLLDDGGVEAEPEMEQEPPIGAVRLRGRAHADARERSRRERPEQLRGGVDRVVRDPERAGEDIGGAARQRRERGVRADQPTGGLVERPVAGEHDDDVDAHLRRFTRQLGRVAALPGLDDFDVVFGRERSGHRSACARRDARSDRVDDQLEAHGAEPYPYDPAVPGTSTDQLRALTDEIVVCRACPRLVEWRERVATEKRASFRDETYWGRPVPGFGDPQARVLIAGLAPAAHGGNRTGRVFTGDRSGDWLFGSLHRLGFANQATSVSSDDGLELRDAYVAAAVRCAPPDNKPTPEERDRCLPYLQRELALLERVRVVVVLGGFAYEALARVLAACGSPLPVPRPKFAHGLEVETERFVVLGCYHPSQQNTFTRRLTEPMTDDVFRRARELADGIP